MATPAHRVQLAAATLFCAALSACGGGSGDQPASAPPPAAAPTPAPAALTSGDFSVSGTVATVRGVAGAYVTAYDNAGRSCGTTTSGPDGRYSLTAKCSFPVVLFADTPAGNDTERSPGVRGEGTEVFTFLGTLTTNKQSFTADITPLTTAVTVLALGRAAAPGVANSRTVLTDARRDQAVAKMRQALSPFLAALSATDVNLLSASYGPTDPLRRLFSLVRVSHERVDSTRQNLFRVHAATEHRPIVLAAIDGRPIEEAYVDTGLGIALSDVNVQRFSNGLAIAGEISGLLQGKSSKQVAMDGCFLHNASKSPLSLYDMPLGWQPNFDAPFDDVRVLRVNTYTNFMNETAEELNAGPADLVLVSYEYANAHGLKQRNQVWMIRGTQRINECDSAGTGWRILGNQRPIYLRTDTIAVAETTYSQQFGTRRDTYGSGTEHFVGSSYASPRPFTHLLISGPGLPSDGIVFMLHDGAYLYTTNTLLQIRQAFNQSATNAKWKDNLIRNVRDTRAYMMADAQVRQISDAYYSSANTYTYRFFRDYADLFPSLTLLDVLPKRPYLSAELPVNYFPSVSVNMDTLVTALQTNQPVTINWSLPRDIRGRSMLPDVVFFSRFNCIKAAQWPSCADRTTQYNEYSVTPHFMSQASEVNAVLTPESLPQDDLKTFRGFVRLQVVDSLNRPIEVRLGMDYQR